MRILISTFGTRGDVQPYVALGKGLKAAGYEVALCTPEGFKPFIEAHDLAYAHVDNEFLALTEQALEAGALSDRLAIAKRFPAAIRRALDDEWRAAQAFEPDAILYHTKSLGSYHIAEKLGIPQILSLPLPSTATVDFPYPFFAGIPLPRRLNRLTYRLMALASAMWHGTVNDFRRTSLGLPPVGRLADLTIGPGGEPVPTLYPYSSHLVPVPADFPDHVHVTGYWFLDQGEVWRPDRALARFLASGTPPVYVGFGSMGASASAARGRLVVEALGMAGQRGVLARGWGGVEAAGLPVELLMINGAAHDWLFPQMAAVVHHGGAGTTAAALRAGKVNVICPFLGDQPFWGWAVHRAGAGPKPIPQGQLTADRLADAIRTALADPAMQQRAVRLGEQIRGEDGVARAVEIIGDILKMPVPVP